MSNFNFFEWMRNGVKSAVLLGVSDAVEEIGMPTQTDGNDKNMLAFLQNAKAQQLEDKTGTTTSSTTRNSGRKRLGRSLKDLEPATK